MVLVSQTELIEKAIALLSVGRSLYYTYPAILTLLLMCSIFLGFHISFSLTKKTIYLRHIAQVDYLSRNLDK